MSEIAQQDQRTPLQSRVLAVRGDKTAIQLRDALPQSVSIERFTRATVTALNQNPDLADADEATFFQSLVKCAMDGLLPDGREAALVIFKGKVGYIPMIAGSRKIAAEFGWTIKTYAIYENDEFDVDLGTNRVTHRPPRIGEDRGSLRGAWANAFHRDGRESIIEVMDEAAIAKARAVAKTELVWKQWPAQMYEKTVGHRIAKKLPLDPQDAQRLSRVIEATEIAPGDAAAALYGPAGSTFSELPAGADLPPTETPSEEADAATDPSGDDGGSAPQTDTQLGADGSGAAASPIDDETRMLADDAASFVPTWGVYAADGDLGPLTLREIHELPDEAGVKYLRMCANRLDSIPESARESVAAYCAVHLAAEQKAA